MLWAPPCWPYRPAWREKKGAELYQITLGGSADEHTSIGEIIGRGFEPEKVTDAVEKIVDTYLGLRLSKEETFLEAYRRVGPQPFKSALYGSLLKLREETARDTYLERNRFSSTPTRGLSKPKR